MVANTIQEHILVIPRSENRTSDPGKPKPNLESTATTTVDPIALFLARNPEAPVVVDFLNVMITGTYAARSFVELWKTLRHEHRGSPLIIVTKKVDTWPNVDTTHAEMVTSADPTVLVVVCDSQGVKKRKRDGPGSGPEDTLSVLAEADDYMIALIDYITSASGCRAKVLSGDKYRNKLDVMRSMLPYDYYVHSSGQTSQHHISTESAWSWVQSIVTHARPFRMECKIAVTRKCKSCRTSRPVCVRCITCATCIASARIDFGG